MPDVRTPDGGVESIVVPGAELAVILHTGAHTDVDRTYGALATYVTEHALAVEGPIREYYVVGSHDTADEASGAPRSAGPSSAPARPANSPARDLTGHLIRSPGLAAQNRSPPVST